MRIVNWDKFQHYKERRPPWIKIHRQLLDSRQWFSLSDGASRLLVECWLVASESADGSLTDDFDDLAFRLHKRADVIAITLQELVDKGFMEFGDGHASNMLATCTTETETEGETETEVTTTDDGFTDFWEAYPKRAGANPKKAALSRWRTNRKAGVAAEEMTAGVKRYAAFLEATEKIGTEFVQQAKTFLGQNEGWKESWQVTEADRAKTEEVHPSVAFNRAWAARAEAEESEDAGSLERLDTEEIMRRIQA